VAKPGEYTAIVWVEDKKLGTFGEKFTMSLKPVPAPPKK
jgi:hypothetical protein